MADEDVWGAGDEVPEGSDPSFGEPDYEAGLTANEAFSVDVVFKHGVAFVQEQPQTALLGGACLFALMLGGQFLAAGLNVGIAGMGATGQLDQEVVNVLSQLSGLVLQGILWPVNQFIIAGLMVASALWMRSDESRLGALFTSVRAAVRGVLAVLVAGIASSAVALVSMAPALAALAYFLSIKDPTTAFGAFALLILPVIPVAIYVGIGVMLTPYAAVLDHLGPIQALQRSWEAADGARVTLFVTSFVFGILSGLSVCLCYLPMAVVVPIQVAGLSVAYLRCSRPSATTAEWPFLVRNA